MDLESVGMGKKEGIVHSSNWRLASRLAVILQRYLTYFIYRYPLPPQTNSIFDTLYSTFANGRLMNVHVWFLFCFVTSKVK